MIKIINIGMSHATAEVELRECLAQAPDSVSKALEFIKKDKYIKEGLFISTCNRVEAFCITENYEESKNSLIALMSQLGNIKEGILHDAIFLNKDLEAVSHIFTVAASLDSMMVGEPQILGQVKEAYSQATKAKTSGVILNRLMHRAFHVAKRIRTETGISNAAVSISYAAVELAKKIFYDLSGKNVLLIGAGEMAELAAKHLLSQGASSIQVANRTFERAISVAEIFNGTPLSFEEIYTQLFDVDIVISSTASSNYIINYDQVKGALRKRRNRPLFFIDIAVPRDIDPRINNLGNVYVYDIDDLKGVIEINMTQRKEEAIKAERIVMEEVIKFRKWMQTLDEVVPTIISLREKAEKIRKKEVGKSLGALKGLTADQMQAIETLTISIAEKIINDPILNLKQKAEKSKQKTYLDLTRVLFNLNQNNNGDKEDEYK